MCKLIKLLSLLIFLSWIISQARPNFVFILVDDLGWADVSPNNPQTFYETPNIQKLADEGTVFSQGYASSPVCSPTRASILCGKNPGLNNLTQFIGGSTNPEYLKYLPLTDTTLAEALKENGYDTFFAGKWHLGKEEKYWPENQGFDINIGGWSGGGPSGGYFGPFTNPRLPNNGPDGEHLPYRLGDECISYLESKKNSAKPFLLYLAFYSVHTRLATTPELELKYQAKADSLKVEGPTEGKVHNASWMLVQRNPIYAGMIESMDKNVGRILDKLKELGMDTNTVVFFTSDNGGLATNGRFSTSNLPLKAGKGWIYEGGIRVPYIIKWPGVTKPGSTSDALAVSMDYYPTILEMAGIPLKPKQHVDGRSLVPVLRNEQSNVHSTLYFHYPHKHGSGHKPSSGIRVGDYKLINFLNNNDVKLYNLAVDIGETNDLASQKPALRDSLLGILQKWWIDADVRFPDGYQKIPGIKLQVEPSVSTKSMVKPIPKAQFNFQHDADQITFNIKHLSGAQSITIYSMNGTKIKEFTNSFKKSDLISLSWNRLDTKGNLTPSGLYVLQVKTSAQAISKIFMVH